MRAWPSVQLGEVCEVLDSLRRPITKRDRLAGPIPYYGASGVLDHVEGLLFDEPLVLLGEDGAKWEAGANSAFAISGPSWVNNHAHVIRPRRDRLDDAWLIYYLNFANLLPFVTGLTVPKLNQEMMRSIPVPLPPLAEQQRIVAILDEAFEDIARAAVITETNIQNADAAFSVALSQDFERLASTVPMRPIGELATKVGSGATPRGGRESYHADGVLLVRSLNVHDRTFRTAGSAYLDEGQAAQLANVAIESEDVLLNITGASIARCCVAPDGAVGGRVNQHVSIIRPRRNVLLSKYLVCALTSAFFKNRLLGIGEAAGSTRQALTKADILRFEVPLPSLDKQIAICKRASELELAVDELRATYSARRELLAELKQSLLARAFSGELTREPLAA